jgi:transposase-like protein
MLMLEPVLFKEMQKVARDEGVAASILVRKWIKEGLERHKRAKVKH